MRQFASHTVFLSCFCSSLATCISDQLNASLDSGSFQKPSARLRPRFRYWIPDPSIDEAVLKDDINSAAAVGSGGVEYLPFYNAGGVLGGAPPGANWTQYGFGTPESNKLFVAALKAHRDAGLVMDFSIGPDQGQGVPAHVDDEGLQWDLIPFTARFTEAGEFDDTVPGWGTGSLVAVITAEALSSKQMTNTTSVSGSPQESYLQLVLKQSTLAERTSEVSSAGHMSVNASPNSNGSNHWLFAFYERLTHHKNLEFESDQSGTIFNNGSYQVDHFSAKGAKVVADFWETHILDQEVKDLLGEAGNYVWEDSVEIKSNISWTPTLPRVFQEKYRYSLQKYLPLIMFGNNNIGLQTSQPGGIKCILDTPDQGVGYVNDFRGALAEGHGQYLATLTAWANSHVGLQMSAQVGYNLPVDMLALIPIVDAPECESLGFKDNIDGYRQYSGPAVLAGKKVVSNEIGAVAMETYRYLVSDLLWSVNRAVVGGVNQFVMHGLAYSGAYYATTWPGYTAFSYFYSESWSNKHPVWEHGFSDFMEYVARLQYTQQTGRLIMDVAIYNKQSATDFSFSTGVGNLAELIKNGYSFSYLSPENFRLPEAYVKKQTLAIDGPAYRALIVPSSTNVTLDSIRDLERFANAGLPIILSGGDPYYYPTGNGSNSLQFHYAIASLKKHSNVHTTNDNNLADKLASLNLEPQIRVHTNSTWYTTWRESDNEDLHFAFILNDGPASQGDIEVRSRGRPYFYDLWTGQVKPVLNYQHNDGIISLHLKLQPNQTMMIGFRDTLSADPSSPSSEACQIYPNTIGYEYDATSGFWDLHVTAGESDHSRSSPTEEKMALNSTSATAPMFALGNWSLTVEHWDAPGNMSDASSIATKHNTTHQMESLTSWTSIPILANVSGLGYYSTSFDWAINTNSTGGAYLIFPQVLHGLRVLVNGQRTPPINYHDAKINIGPYLKSGLNEITAIVPTTMWNYLRSIFDDIVMSGYPPLITLASPGPLPPPVDNGLVGTVYVVPYVEQRIKA